MRQKWGFILSAGMMAGLVWMTVSCGKNPPTAPSAITPTPAVTSTPTPVPAVYVYFSDSATAQSFQTLLNANGYNTTIVTTANAAALNYANYGLILISSDSGAGVPWNGTYNLPNQIFTSNKPILGIGAGGAYFFQTEVLNEIGYSNTASATGELGVLEAAPSNPIWSSPYAVSASGAGALMTTAVTSIETYMPAGTGVTAIGSDPNSSAYDSITTQTAGGHNYLLWSFEAAPSGMTTAGKNLFVNATHVVY